MVYYDAELQDLYEKVARKRRLDIMLQDLAKQEELLAAKVSKLETEKNKEQADVDKLEGRSLSAFFYGVVGKKDEKLDQERAEAYAAAVKYDAAVHELSNVEYEIKQGKSERDALQNCEVHYERILEQKAAAIKESNKPESGKILKMEERISYLKNQEREIEEAVEAGNIAQNTIRDILSSLDSAKDWGVFDLAGGDLLTDMVKYSHLDEAQGKVEQLQVELRRFKTELADVAVQADLQVSVDGFLRFADFFFDGLFSDWTVLERISSSKNQVQDTQKQLAKVQTELVSMKKEILQEQTNLEQELEELVRNTPL